MACSGSKLKLSQVGCKIKVVDVSDWTLDQQSCHCLNRSNTGSCQKRADIVYAIICNQATHHLRTIVESGWDVNEILNVPTPQIGHWKPCRLYRQTALHMAVRHWWTEGVKILLEAGAKCIISGVIENPLKVIMQGHGVSGDHHADLIELLLQHGADPNDHDGQFANIPLLDSIVRWRGEQNCTRVPQLLLEHGADPNVRGEDHNPWTECPLLVCASYFQFENKPSAALFKMLLHFGADVNYSITGTSPLIHEMILKSQHCPRIPVFLQEQLDLFYLHGGNVSMEDHDHRTALEYAVRKGAHTNSIRWLIRHGADTSCIKVTLLKEYLIPHDWSMFWCFPETPLVLLQAGIRVSHGVQTQLSNIETAISTWLQDDDREDENINQIMQAMFAKLEEADKNEHPMRQHNSGKVTFLENLTHQQLDLQEFSDMSLQVYNTENTDPGNYNVSNYMGRNSIWQNVLDRIHTMLEFLSQPQSLQWHSRCCIREKLVSLQPSVVKTLPGPARLKCYILCHEI